MPLFGSPNVEKLKAKKDISGLIKALDHEDSSVRATAARALGQLGYDSDPTSLDRPPGIEELLRILRGQSVHEGGRTIHLQRDEDPGVRAAAAEALGELGRPDTLTSLLDAGTVTDVSGDAALRAFEAIGMRYPSPAGEHLKRRLFSSTEHWGGEAERWGGEAGSDVLGRLTPSFLAEILLASIWGDSTDHFVDVADVIRTAGRDAVKACLRALDSEEPMRRVVAACVLDQIPDERAVEPLIKALNDGERQVRTYAARALEALNDDRAEKALAEFNARPVRPPVERRPLP